MTAFQKTERYKELGQLALEEDQFDMCRACLEVRSPLFPILRRVDTGVPRGNRRHALRRSPNRSRCGGLDLAGCLSACPNSFTSSVMPGLCCSALRCGLGDFRHPGTSGGSPNADGACGHWSCWKCGAIVGRRCSELERRWCAPRRLSSCIPSIEDSNRWVAPRC